MFVRTERLFLRPAWPEDADDILGALEEYEIVPEGWIEPLPRTVWEVQRFLEQPRDPLLPHFFMYLRSPEGPALVGGIGFGRSGDDVEMGYWVHPRYRGRGYATEAIRAALCQAKALGHRRIFAKHYTDCPASAHVLEGAGFRLVKEANPHISGHLAGESVRVFVADLEGRSNPRMESSVEVA